MKITRKEEIVAELEKIIAEFQKNETSMKTKLTRTEINDIYTLLCLLRNRI